MHIAIRYFTRSGNTARLAEAIGQAIGVAAAPIDQPLNEKTDILFLGCSYYAFDMDPEVKQFLTQNKAMIGRVVCFGTSAMMKSMKKPMTRVLKDTGITLAEDEFHCRGSFGRMHKGRPDADDLKAAAAFALRVIG